MVRRPGPGEIESEPAGLMIRDNGGESFLKSAQPFGWDQKRGVEYHGARRVSRDARNWRRHRIERDVRERVTNLSGDGQARGSNLFLCALLELALNQIPLAWACGVGRCLKLPDLFV